ncbi:MAG: methyltransferase domain-containing protein [Flavobacteriales bacterium]
MEQHRETLPHCPICRSTTFRPGVTIKDHSITQESFQVVACSSCGFTFTNPRPLANELDRYYASDDYISHSNRSRGLKEHLYQLARRRAIRGKHNLIARYHPNGRVLDIGCGTGQFLAYLASRGYLVQGVEPSTTAREQAIREHALAVVPAITGIIAQENFQVATLWHVLEHVPDLRATFKRLYALLAKGGLLVIAVPDRESWDATHYGTDWAAWDVPRHLSHFRRDDLKTLLREHGFELLEIRRMWLDAYYIALLSEGYRGRSALLAFPLAVLKGTWSNLLALLGSRPTSSSLYVARKAEA